MAGGLGMGLGLGQAAGGAARGLQDVLTQRLRERSLLQQMMAEQEQARLEQQRINQTGEWQRGQTEQMAGLRKAQEDAARQLAAEREARIARQEQDDQAADAYIQSLPAGSPERKAAEYERRMKAAIPAAALTPTEDPVALGLRRQAAGLGPWPPREPQGPAPVVVNEFDEQGNPVPKFYRYQGGQMVPVATPTGVTPRLSAAASGAIAETKKQMDQLDRLEKLFKPEYVGPVAGRLGTFGQRVPGLPSDPQAAAFYAANAQVKNELIKFLSGATVPTSEVPRLMQSIPSEADKPEVWQSKLNVLRNGIQAAVARGLQSAGAPRTGAPTGQGGPAIGDRKTFPNGVIGVWDGTGWVKQ